MQVGAQMIQRNSEKVFRSCQRERKIMLTGRQDYTNPDSCREMPDSGDRANEL